ncbi:XrtA system polysaccharide chain length determinant [Sphingomonas cavernae]|uniref:Chain-length determining protein n=1 Tax=Sphingomonas cavernae TaxID=2320861 RepID=A0A418WN46_9SPHN|nr:XrtA system polysaccharide chain length determinant [Sphingomonas cavernae]RJF91426.1 chain-length determining protein [Sphingomonas cavernae]
MNGVYDEIRIVLHGLWQRRWLALAVGWAICLVGWLVVSLIPNSYESHARIFVQMQSILPEKIGITPVERQREIDRVRQTLTSAVNLEKIVRGTDLRQTVASERDVADKVAVLQETIKVTAQRDNLFEITATASFPGMSDAGNAKLARDIAQKLIDIFVAENMAGGREETQQTLRFLDSQLAEREQQLQDAEQKRMAFEQQYTGLLPGVGSLAERMQAARVELSQVDADLGAAQSSLSAVNAQMAGTGSTAGAMPSSAGPAAQRLAEIEGQIAGARARGWTEAHPDVVALNRQLSAARAAASGEPRIGGGAGAASNPLYISLRAMQAEKQSIVAALSARKNQLQRDMNLLMAKQSADPGVVAEQGRISRDHDVLKQQYDKLLEDREQIRLRNEVESQTDSVIFKLIDPPTSPRIPVSPNRPLLLVLVLVAGVGGGIAAAFAKGQLQTTYATGERLAKASGLHVIGTISEVLSTAEREARRKKLRWFAGGAGGLAAMLVLLLLVEFIQRGMVA